MAPLLKPSQCILLVIESIGVFNAQVAQDDCRGLMLQAAALCGVPSFRAAGALGRIKSPPPGETLLPSQQIHPFETTAEWSETALGAALAATGRSGLLLCGYWLDECITFAAIAALAEGYDTYLLTDASPPLDTDARDTAMLRLVQAGVVPTTTRQAIREWAAVLSDPGLNDKLLALVGTIDPRSP